MDTLSDLILSLPSTRGTYDGVIGAMCARSGAARAAYASVQFALSGASLFARMRRLALGAGAQFGMQHVAVHKAFIRFSMPHPALKNRRVSVKLYPSLMAEAAGHLHAEFGELGDAVVAMARRAGVEARAEFVSVSCCQVYWYTGASVDVGSLVAPEPWALVARGPPMRLRSGLVSACVYGNGTVSFVARCMTQLGRAHAALFDAMARSRAGAEIRGLLRNGDGDEEGDDAAAGGAAESSESEYDDERAPHDRRAHAARVTHTVRTKRPARRAVVVQKQGGGVGCHRRRAHERKAAAAFAGPEAAP
jgi:hypothetical protein